MRNFLNAINEVPHPEEARGAVSKDADLRVVAVRHFFHRLSAGGYVVDAIKKNASSRGASRSGASKSLPPRRWGTHDIPSALRHSCPAAACSTLGKRSPP